MEAWKMKSTESTNTQKVTDKKDCWQLLLSHSFANGDAVAFWRLPNQDTQQLIIAKTEKKLSKETTLEELEAGFMLAPFVAEERTFLSADYYFRFSTNALKAPESPAETNAHAWLKQLRPIASAPVFYEKNSTVKNTAVRGDYVNLVNEAVQLIKTGATEKIVPSRTKRIEASVDLLDAFDKLCQRYPAAMVSLVSTPEHGTWLGATPELLVSLENQQIFKTVALAGTKAWTPGTDSKNVAWTQKEIEEQALVERYIISCFKKIRLRDYEEHGPKTIVAGNLMHLKSDFKVDMKETNFAQLGTVMLNLLHPTSAVCGMPKELSLQFLLQNEGYDRELYSGYLGPINIQQNTELFVNLRCLQWRKSGVQLYAGAGVTIDSVAEKEWEETEMKMNTLLSVIFENNTSSTN
jgi:isochorismate synthase